jgi:predicted transcriptional regulator
MASTPFSIRLDQKIKKRLESEAKREKRSAGFVVHEALEFYLNGKDYERKMVEEAIAEADKGIFISGEKVHRWMESLGTERELPFPEPDIYPETALAMRKAG